MFNEFKKSIELVVDGLKTSIVLLVDYNVKLINALNRSIKTTIDKLVPLLSNYIYLIVTSVVLVIIFLGSFGLINWKKDFGVADVINITLALLTFTAVKYTRIAAESSKQANTLSKQALEYTHKPKLMPLDTSIFLPISKINEEIGSRHVLNEFRSELKLILTNVYEGNAYNVSAWMSVNEESLENLELKETSKLYQNFFSEEYRIFFPKSFNDSEMKVSMLTIQHGVEDSLDFDHFYIDRESHDSIPLLKAGEDTNIYVPSYVSVILHHLVYNPNLIEKFQPTKSIKLHIKYKTNDELDSDNYITQIYGVEIPRAHIVSDQTNKYQPHVLLELKYSLLK